MQRAETLDDFRRRRPPRAVYRLTFAEQLLLCLLVLGVDGALLGLAWLVGWSWMLEFGRLTLVLPTLLSAVAWYVYCSRRSRRQHGGSTAAEPSRTTAD